MRTERASRRDRCKSVSPQVRNIAWQAITASDRAWVAAARRLLTLVFCEVRYSGLIVTAEMTVGS